MITRSISVTTISIISWMTSTMMILQLAPPFSSRSTVDAFSPSAGTRHFAALLELSHDSNKINKRRQQSTWPSSVVRLHQSNDNSAGVVETSNTTAASTDVDVIASSASDDDELSMLLEKVEAVFPNGAMLTMTMKDHRPLGCTVEESLNEEDDYVFISRITEGGNAEKAGVQVGDVVVGVTGLFGELTIVMDSGVDKITRLVSSVPDEDPLSIQIVRGTNVLERHETAIVDLCNLSGASEKEVENCVVDFLSGGYEIAEEEEEEDIMDDVEDNSEDLIGDMYNLWANEVPLPPTTSGITDQVNGDTSGKKPKPWSSRSSGSGTWVRDPKTGEMRNIDS